MADGRGKRTGSDVNNCSANLIGQNDFIANDIPHQTFIQQKCNTDNFTSEWNDLENENNSEFHGKFDVGGVNCDTEDKGCLDLDRNKSDSSRFLPRLVFIDSEENISGKTDNSLLSDSYVNKAVHREVRSASDTAVLKKDGSSVRKSHLSGDSDLKQLINDYPDPLLQCQNSYVSQRSSDSDLITDHTMHTEQELAQVGEEDFEQFLMEHSDRDPKLESWHCHSTTAKVPQDKMARNQLIAVSILCFLFMVGEAIGGALSNSLALFTDVLHLGSDLISFLISLLSMYLAKKHATRNMSFGYHRAEVLGALFSVFIIWSVTGVLVYVAIERIIKEHYKDVKPDEMLITAVLGVVFNIVCWSGRKLVHRPKRFPGHDSRMLGPRINKVEKEFDYDQEMIPIDFEPVGLYSEMGIVLHSEMCCGKSSSRPSFGHGHSHGHSHGHGHSHDTNSSHNSENGYQRAPNHRHSDIGGERRGDYEPLLPDEENLQMGGEEDLRNPDLTMSENSENSDKPHQKNINVRAAFIHVIGDIIQSMGVLLASIIIKLKPEEKYRLADPICTFLFSILVLFTTITVLRDTLRIIMEGVPHDTNYFSIKQSLQKIIGVKAVHGLTVWCLTLEKNALAVHLAIDKTVTHQKVLYEASQVLKDRYNLVHTTIQIEDYKPEIMTSCYSCQELKK